MVINQKEILFIEENFPNTAELAYKIASFLIPSNEFFYHTSGSDGPGIAYGAYTVRKRPKRKFISPIPIIIVYESDIDENTERKFLTGNILLKTWLEGVTHKSFFNIPLIGGKSLELRLNNNDDENVSGGRIMTEVKLEFSLTQKIWKCAGGVQRLDFPRNSSSLDISHLVRLENSLFHFVNTNLKEVQVPTGIRHYDRVPEEVVMKYYAT